MNTPTKTVTIGIDYTQIAKAVMAEIAMAIAGRTTEVALPFARCRMQELAIAKSQTACMAICSTLSGYIAGYTADSDGMEIDIMLPATMTDTEAHIVASRIEEAITARVVAEFIASIPDFAREAQQSQAYARHATSSLKQLLCKFTVKA